jgi:hypothetical protein
VEYASLYEVSVEVRAGNEWLEITRKTSKTETFIDCPLFIGNYRFRVSVYDLLGKPGSTTEWIYFEVRAPEKTESPPQAQAPIQSAPPVSDTPPQTASIDTGTPQYYVPPEFNAPEESEKSMFRLEALLSPLIVLPFSEFNEIYATSPVQPVGVVFRLAALPFKTPAGVFGVELIPAWNYMANDILHKSRYTHIFSGHAAFLWQTRPFNQRTAINVRGGGGLSYINSRFVFNDGLDSDKLDAWNPSVFVGASFVWFINKSLFVDAGFEYYHIFTLDNIALNYLRPSVGLGWWF